MWIEVIVKKCPGCGRKNTKRTCWHNHPEKVKYCSSECRIKYDQKKEGLGEKGYQEFLAKERARYHRKKNGIHRMSWEEYKEYYRLKT